MSPSERGSDLTGRAEVDAGSRGPGRPVGRRGGEGRDALLRAARALMAEQGSKRLTSKQVSERAGVKPALVHYYFGSRDGLLEAVTSTICEETSRRLDAAARPGGTTEQRLRRLVRALLVSFAEQPYSARLLLEQVDSPGDDVHQRYASEHGRAQIDAIRSILEAGTVDQSLRPLDPALAISAIGGICAFLVLTTPLLGKVIDGAAIDKDNIDPLAAAVTDLLLHGLVLREEVTA